MVALGFAPLSCRGPRRRGARSGAVRIGPRCLLPPKEEARAPPPAKGGGVWRSAQLDSAWMTSPKNSQLSPLKRISCIASIGAKSVSEVFTWMPGSRIGTRTSSEVAAAWISSRPASGPAFSSASTMVMAMA